MTDLINFVINPYLSYSFWQIMIECIATFLGILSVVLAAKKNIWVYPTGIASTFIYSILLFQWELFGDMLINVYYTIMSVYGWILWSKHSTDSHLNVISKLNKNNYLNLFLVFSATFTFVILIYLLIPSLKFLNINDLFLSKIESLTLLNYIDAITTSIFLLAMWLMAKGKIENWYFWVLGDIIAIPMFLIKGYAITSFQYLIFILLSIYAFKKWKKNLIIT